MVVKEGVVPKDRGEAPLALIFEVRKTRYLLHKRQRETLLSRTWVNS